MHSGNWASRLAPSVSQHITVSRALKQKNLYLGTGPGWTLCKSMYTVTQGAFVVDSHPLWGGKKQSMSVMG